MGYKKIELAGEKVRLRLLKGNDAIEAYHLITDDAILSQLNWEGPENIDEMVEIYDRFDEIRKVSYDCRFAIERIDDHVFMGTISIHFPRHPHMAQIGYWLGVPYWGNGYMTEAIRLVCYLCFKYLYCMRVSAEVFTGNEASRRILEKNSFSLDGTLRYNYVKRGTWRDSWFFTLLKKEWQVENRHYTIRKEEVIFSSR